MEFERYAQPPFDVHYIDDESEICDLNRGAGWHPNVT
jgi:hypothetical protein